MTTDAPTATSTEPDRIVGPIALSRRLTRFALLEMMRSPGAIVMSVGFPSFILLVFAGLSPTLGSQPELATEAAVQMAVFSALMVGLFSVGLDTARSREDPWSGFLRSLPAPGYPRILASIAANGLLALVAVVVLTVVAATTTAATTTPAHYLAGIAALAVGWTVFLLLGTVIASAFSFRTSLSVMMPTMVVNASLGGLWFSTDGLPAWLSTAVRVLPVRGAKDLVGWAVLGSRLEWWDVVGVIGWTVLLGWAAIRLMNRERDRRS